jgi:hypothetical protein
MVYRVWVVILGPGDGRMASELLILVSWARSNCVSKHVDGW